MIVVQLTRIAISSIRSRLGSSLVTVLGTAALVILLMFFDAVTSGLNRMLVSSGRADRAIVLRSGADTESTSLLPRTLAETVSSAAGLQHEPDQGPIVSPELVTDIRVGSDLQRAGNVTLRAVDPIAWTLRPEIAIDSGRMFRPGTFELIVGRTALSHADGALNIGSEVRIGDSNWKVVGVFRSDRDVHETEAFADLGAVLSAYRSSLVSAFVVRLDSDGAFDAFSADLRSRPNLSVDVHRESSYYRELAERSSSLISVVSTFICALMAIGSIFAAAHTVFSAVSARTRELATLRALGFSDTAILGSIVLETLLLGLIGATLAAAILLIGFAGRPVALPGANEVQKIVIAFTITIRSVGVAVLLTLVVCALGAVVPARGVLRLDVATALRRV